MIFDSTRHDIQILHPDVSRSGTDITIIHDDAASRLVMVRYTARATSGRPAVSWLGMATRASLRRVIEDRGPLSLSQHRRSREPAEDDRPTDHFAA